MNAPIKAVGDRYSGEQIASYYAAGHWQPASSTLSPRSRPLAGVTRPSSSTAPHR